MAIYSGTCTSMTLIECDDDDSNNGLMPMIQRTGLTPGSTIYIRFWEYGNDNQGTFSLCAYDASAPTTPGTGAIPGACPGQANNDFCAYPAILTQGPGTFSSSTTNTYSADTPGNLNSLFCGSIENNSWYQFTATATTHTFPIISVTGCTYSYGVQAQVFNVTKDANGCCTGFTSVSNCFNPTTVATGTVTATGLTIGNTYVFMIDGWAGDACQFTISGWTATGILPVVLSEFNGQAYEHGNLLQWVTESENKNDYFEILYSRDAYHFTKIGTKPGAGNSSIQNTYEFMHAGVAEGTSFYQLIQVNLDGERTESPIISVNRKKDVTGLFSVYPNPARNELLIQLYGVSESEFNITLLDHTGKMVYTEQYIGSSTTLIRSMSHLTSGIYTLQITSKNSVQQQRIIKID